MPTNAFSRDSIRLATSCVFLLIFFKTSSCFSSGVFLKKLPIALNGLAIDSPTFLNPDDIFFIPSPIATNGVCIAALTDLIGAVITSPSFFSGLVANLIGAENAFLTPAAKERLLLTCIDVVSEILVAIARSILFCSSNASKCFSCKAPSELSNARTAEASTLTMPKISTSVSF